MVVVVTVVEVTSGLVIDWSEILRIRSLMTTLITSDSNRFHLLIFAIVDCVLLRSNDVVVIFETTKISLRSDESKYRSNSVDQ